MDKSGGRHGPRTFPLGGAVALITGVLITGVLALGGCTSQATSSFPASSTSPASAASAASAASPGGTAGCNADYCPPPDWDTARASTPLTQIPPFAEPLNVVISARSTVSLAAIKQSLGDWPAVSTATTVSVVGIHIKCISSELADVTGGGYVPQQMAWRLGGCVSGNKLSLAGNEDHVRIWNQPAAGSRYGAWFIAASYETMCIARNGVLEPARDDAAYAALHPGSAYHCVDGGPGSIRTTHANGYDDAARDFSAAIVTAGRGHGWQVALRTVTVPRGARAGEGGVPFGSTVYVVTVTVTG